MPYRLAVYTPRYPGETLITLLKGRLPAYRRLAAVGGDLSVAQVGRYRVYLLQHPDLIGELLTEREAAFTKGTVLQQAHFLFGEGLLTSEGAQHRAHRKVVGEAFRHHRIQAYVEPMVMHAQAAHHRWQAGTPVVIDRLMRDLTLSVVAHTLFGVTARSQTQSLAGLFDQATRVLARKTRPVANLLGRVTLLNAVQARLLAWRLDQAVSRLLAQRAQAANPPDDLLAHLLAARNRPNGLTDQEVRDEIVTLLVSGYETTAVALTWFWYELAAHPEVEARLHAEVDAVLQGQPIHSEQVQQLPYTRQVIAEILRIYTPVWAFARQATVPVQIGGHQIPAGAYVLVSPLLMHRDSRWWPSPDRFDPQRFDPKTASTRPKFTYLPFSVGPRGCIGEHFAWTELITVTATIAQHWQLQRANARPVRPAGGLLTLRPKRPVRMIPVRRT